MVKFMVQCILTCPCAFVCFYFIITFLFSSESVFCAFFWSKCTFFNAVLTLLQIEGDKHSFNTILKSCKGPIGGFLSAFCFYALNFYNLHMLPSCAC